MNNGTQDLFFFLAVSWTPFLLSLSSISLLYRSQFACFMLMLVRCCIGVIMTSICKLMRFGKCSEPRFVFFCQLVEVIREADANETSVELGFALPVNLVGESPT